MRSLLLQLSLLSGRAVSTLDEGTVILVHTRPIEFPGKRFLMLLDQALGKLSDHVFPFG